MAEAQQRQLLILTINEQIRGRIPGCGSVKPERWRSAFFCSIIPFEIGRVWAPAQHPPSKAQVSLLPGAATLSTATALYSFPSPFERSAEARVFIPTWRGGWGCPPGDL